MLQRLQNTLRYIMSGDTPGGSGSSAENWALVDGVQIGGGTTDGARWKPIDRWWIRASSWDAQLDPVTRLDVNPEAPYERYSADPVAVVLFHARGQAIPKRTPPGSRP